MSKGMRKSVLAALALLLLFFSPRLWQATIWGCPFCDAPTTTLSEQLGTCHVAVLVKWVSAEKPAAMDFAEGTTTYAVLASIGPGAAQYPVNHPIVVPRYISGRAEDECLLFGSLNDEKLAWGLPLPISRDCWKYIISAPAKELPVKDRLPFFLAHLEHADPEIAMDAYSEFAGIPYEELKAIRKQLPREKVIAWLQDPFTIPTRKGLFGLMLGLCGTPADVPMMEAIIRLQPEDSRMGIDGLMAGYLLLTGNKGLQQLSQWKLDDPATPDHEIYSLLKTLEFMWTYGREHVEPAQLRLTLRQILVRPQLTGLVVLDLARWQDWEVMDQLAGSYGQEPYADAHPRQCIVRYLLAAAKDAPAADSTGIDYRARAKDYLAKIREHDPATVRYAERYPFD